MAQISGPAPFTMILLLRPSLDDVPASASECGFREKLKPGSSLLHWLLMPSNTAVVLLGQKEMVFAAIAHHIMLIGS
jgi:hypothetical protein